MHTDETFTTRLHYNGVVEAEERCGRHYVNGELQYIHKCDPKRWSKLEVDDVLDKLGVDVSGLDYFYRKPRMSLEDGMVRLFDNKSAIEMAEIGVQAGVIDVYAIHEGSMVIDSAEVPEGPVSQLTQEKIQSPVRKGVARELQFEGPQFVDGLTTSEDDDSEDDGDGDDEGAGEGEGEGAGEEDWLVQSSNSDYEAGLEREAGLESGESKE